MEAGAGGEFCALRIGRFIFAIRGIRLRGRQNITARRTKVIEFSTRMTRLKAAVGDADIADAAGRHARRAAEINIYGAYMMAVTLMFRLPSQIEAAYEPLLQLKRSSPLWHAATD